MIASTVKLILEVELTNTMKSSIELVVKQKLQIKQFVSGLKGKGLLNSEIDLEGQNYTVKNHLGNPIDVNQQIGLLAKREDGYRYLVIQNLGRSNIELPNSQQQANVDNSIKQIWLAVLTNNAQRLKSIYYDKIISEADWNILSKLSVQAQKQWRNKQDNHENTIKQLRRQIQEKQQILQRKCQQNQCFQQIIGELNNVKYQGQKYKQVIKIKVLNQVQQIQEKILWAQSLSIQSEMLKMYPFKQQCKQLSNNLEQLLKQTFDKIPTHMSSLYFHPQPPPNFLSVIPFLPMQQNLLIMMHMEMGQQQKKEQKLFCIYINEELIPNKKIRKGLLFNLLTGRSYQHKNKNLCCYAADHHQFVIADHIIVVKNGKIQVKKKIFFCGQTEINQVFKEGDIWNVKAIQILSVHLSDNVQDDVEQA